MTNNDSKTLQTDNSIQFKPPTDLVKWAKEDIFVYQTQYESMCKTLVIFMRASNKDMIDEMEKELNVRNLRNVNEKYSLMIEELERNYDKIIEGDEESKLNTESSAIKANVNYYAGKFWFVITTF